MTRASGYSRPRLYLRFPGIAPGPHEESVVRRMARHGHIDASASVSVDGRRWFTLDTYLTSTGQRKEAERLAGQRHSVALFGDAPPHQKSPDTGANDSDVLPLTTSALLEPTPLSADFDPESAHGRVHLAFRLGAEGYFWTVFLSIFPLLLLWLIPAFSLGLNTTIVMTSGYYCLLMAVLLRSVLRVHTSRWRMGLGFMLFTAFLGMLILTLWQHFQFVQVAHERLRGTEHLPWAERFFHHFTAVAVLEETCKLLPLLFFAMKRHLLSHPSDGLWLGALSGLGFAWAEGVQYTYTYWGGTAVEHMLSLSDTTGPQEAVVVQLLEQGWLTFLIQQVRFLTLPVLHAGWSALAGWFAAMAYITTRWELLGAGWLAAAVLHAFYNSLAGALGGVLVASATVFLLIWIIQARPALRRHAA